MNKKNDLLVMCYKVYNINTIIFMFFFVSEIFIKKMFSNVLTTFIQDI